MRSKRQLTITHSDDDGLSRALSQATGCREHGPHGQRIINVIECLQAGVAVVRLIEERRDLWATGPL